MVKPFIEDRKILASEPIKFSYRRKDHWLTRYFALIGMGDPINLFIGNYDRYSFISDRWTNLNLKVETKKDYLKVELKDSFPTIGANGFLIRKYIFNSFPVGNYMFDIDVLKKIAQKSPVYVAKVKIGILHLFSGDISTFIRKQRRRIRDYLFYRSSGRREEFDDKNVVYFGVFKFMLACFLIFPLLYQSIIGFSRKKDWVWIFHPIACYITLFSYTYETIRSFFIKEEYNRKGWKQ